MTANPKTLENLQASLSMELTASLQYMLHAQVLEDWGMNLLAARMREEMREELGHADEFLRRIMFLKGEPVLTPAKTPQRAQSLQDMFAVDLADEEHAIKFYTEAARIAGEAGDIGSRALFEKIALDEEGHSAWLDLQLDLLKRIGEPAYIAKYMSIDEPQEE